MPLSSQHPSHHILLALLLLSLLSCSSSFSGLFQIFSRTLPSVFLYSCSSILLTWTAYGTQGFSHHSQANKSYGSISSHFCFLSSKIIISVYLLGISSCPLLSLLTLNNYSILHSTLFSSPVLLNLLYSYFRVVTSSHHGLPGLSQSSFFILCIVSGHIHN